VLSWREGCDYSVGPFEGISLRGGGGGGAPNHL
jgi:hypothetical protein